MRHLFQHLDSNIAENHTVIVARLKKKLNKYESLAIVSFNIMNNICYLEIFIDNLSTNKQYLMETILSIKKGKCLKVISHCKKIVWYTFTKQIGYHIQQNSIVLYVTTPNSKSNRSVLTELLVKMHAHA